MLIRGGAIESMPNLGRYGAIITDPPMKIYYDDQRDWLHNTRWLDMAMAMADVVIFTVSREVANKFPIPNRIIDWKWAPHRSDIYIYGKADLPDEIIEPWPHQEAFGHASCKPLPLLKRLVAGTYGAVLDPFMGTGTTGVATVLAGREFTGIEIEETHFQTATVRINHAMEEAGHAAA